MRTAAAALKKKSFSARAIHGNTGSNPAVANLDSRRRPSLGCYSNSSAEAAEDARKAEKQRKGSGAGNRFADRFADDRWAAFLTPTPAFTLTPTPAFTLTLTPAFTLTLTPTPTPTLTRAPTRTLTRLNANPNPDPNPDPNPNPSPTLCRSRPDLTSRHFAHVPLASLAAPVKRSNSAPGRLCTRSPGRDASTGILRPPGGGATPGKVRRPSRRPEPEPQTPKPLPSRPLPSRPLPSQERKDSGCGFVVSGLLPDDASPSPSRLRR